MKTFLKMDDPIDRTVLYGLKGLEALIEYKGLLIELEASLERVSKDLDELEKWARGFET